MPTNKNLIIKGISAESVSTLEEIAKNLGVSLDDLVLSIVNPTLTNITKKYTSEKSKEMEKLARNSLGGISIQKQPTNPVQAPKQPAQAAKSMTQSAGIVAAANNQPPAEPPASQPKE